jgi:hypothetical protein
MTKEHETIRRATRPQDEPLEADRWLYVHMAEVVGAGRARAVGLVGEAGLIPRVARYERRPVDSSDFNPGRISLYVATDGRVRSAEWG